MSPLSLAEPPRAAVVDLGSNSVRLVVFEGRGRNPTAIFNEKAVLRLGRGLHQTGRLNDDGVEQALTVLRRYHALARAMHADPFDILATAAVRDAANGPAFVRQVGAALPGVGVRVLTGEQEAHYSAAGLLCGIPAGGTGFWRISVAAPWSWCSWWPARCARRGLCRSGVLRLSDSAGGDPVRARAIAEEALESVPWLSEGIGRDLYLVGGAWRALARIHMEQTGYPLAIVHHYTLDREEARDLSGVIGSANRRALERMPGISRRRVDDMPFAAVVLRRLLRATGARRVVFSANGLREGWFMELVPEAVRAEAPLLAAGQEMALRYGRSPSLRRRCSSGRRRCFPTSRPRRCGCGRRRAGFPISAATIIRNIGRSRRFSGCCGRRGWRWTIMRGRFLALTLALRYEAEPDMGFLDTARMLLDFASLRRAEILGTGLRLAYTLSGGTAELLAGTRLLRGQGRLTLVLQEGSGVFAGDSVTRRLDRLAQAAGLEASTHVTVGPGGEFGLT